MKLSSLLKRFSKKNNNKYANKELITGRVGVEVRDQRVVELANCTSNARQNVAENKQPSGQTAEGGQPEKESVQENGQELPIALHLVSEKTKIIFG